MIRLHAHLVGDTVVLPPAEFEQLVELARRSAEVAVHIEEDDTPAAGDPAACRTRRRFFLARRRAGHLFRR
jgi:hypothetical protein